MACTTLSLLDHLVITVLLVLARDIIIAGVVIAPPPTRLRAPSPTPHPLHFGPPTRTPRLPPPLLGTPPLTPLPRPWLGAPSPAHVPPRLGAPSRTPILPSPKVGAPPPIPPRRRKRAPPPAPRVKGPIPSPVIPPPRKGTPPSNPIPAPRLGVPLPTPPLPRPRSPAFPSPRNGAPRSSPPLPTPRLGAPLPSLLPLAPAPILPPHRKGTPPPTPRFKAPVLPPRRKGPPPAPHFKAPVLPPHRKGTPPPAPHFKAPILPPGRKRTPPPAPHFKAPVAPPRQKGTPPPTPHFKAPVLPPRRKRTPPPAPRVKAPIPSPVIPPWKDIPPSTPIPAPRLGVPLPSPIRQPPRTPIVSPPRKRNPPSSPPPRLGVPLPSPVRQPPRTPIVPPPRKRNPPSSPPRLGAPLPSPLFPPPHTPVLPPPPQYAADPPPPPPPMGGPKVPALIAFGDSIVDTGNNNYLMTVVKANFPPYGKEYPGHKATGRFSDGKITVDFLASAFGLKETLPPYLNKNLTLEDLKTGVSFASAGSGYNNATCRTSSTMTIERQLQLFSEYKAKVGSIPERALFVVCSGSNDIVEHFTLADSMTSPEYAEMMARRAIGLVEALIGQGARQIALTGAPPVGCVPSQRRIAGGVRTQCATDRNQLALLFNRKVSLEVAKLSGKYRGVNIFYVDLYSIVADVVQRYQDLGFKDGKDACCGYIGLAVGPLCNVGSRTCPDPSKYVFWDSYHPTERAYKIMIDDFLRRYTRYIH